ncbi:hypothetical protein KKB18_07760 [bacterium]|nr:hypothetical protein [bacterium]
MKLGNFIRDLIDYFQLFTIPSGLQKTSKILMSKIQFLNRFYSLIFHSNRSTTTLSFPAKKGFIQYRGDLFFEHYLEKKLGEMGITEIKKVRAISKSSEEIDILKFNRFSQKDYIKKGYLITPDWIRASIPLKKGNFYDNFNRSVKRGIKKLEELDFSSYLIPASKILDKFYYEFYKPYIQSLYGESSILKDYSRLRFFAEKSNIINIKCKDYTAALVYVLPAKDSKLYVYAAGIRDDLEDLTKGLVQDAIYFFSIKLAVENGFDIIDFGLNRSFLTDGVLNYKRKWGCKFSLLENSVYNIAINPDSEIIKDFIADNPLFIIDGSELSSLFYFKANPPDLESVLKEKKIWEDCGINKIYFISPSGFAFDVNEIENSHPNLKMVQKDLNDFFFTLK